MLGKFIARDFIAITGVMRWFPASNENTALKTFQFWIQKSVSDGDFLFTFIVYHMADKDKSDLVMVSNESETDSNPRKRQGTLVNGYIISNEFVHHERLTLGETHRGNM